MRFTEADWQRIERDWMAWWRGELERPLVVVESCPGIPDAWSQVNPFLTQYSLTTPIETILDAIEPALSNTYWLGDAFPKVWVNFGAGIVAGFLGSDVVHRTETTWFAPLQVRSLADIQIAFDPDNVWWQRVCAFTQAMSQRWGDSAVIGYTDLGGNLDILASLRGTQPLLMELYDAPEEIDRLTGEITAVWVRYYESLHQLLPKSRRGVGCWGPCWSPERGYMLQSDFAYMISPKMFERWVMPDLEACCAAMDYGFYHMDGKGQIPHLEHLLSLDRLRGIQWQPGDGAPMAEGWLELLKRIRDGGKLCQVYVTREGARAIQKELGGKGFLFVIEEDLTPEEGQAFVNELR
ncbi:MAG: hypothetical protein JXB35_13560 [Anaerolineae bacterium]|nr:hypothetical protein [Anaerolineae bacterium]